MSASLVLLQPDFVTNTLGDTSPDETKTRTAQGIAVTDSKIIISDGGYHRATIYNSIPPVDYTSPDYVLGQAVFTTMTYGTTADEFYSPYFISSNGTMLALAGINNNRVLLWNNIPAADGQAADVVVGQPDFTANTGGTTDILFNAPRAVFLINSKMLVADTGNNRILIYNFIPSTDSEAADIVLGQTTMTGSSTGRTSSTFSSPYAVWTDGTKVIIADSLNHRVLIWNSFPTSNASACTAAGMNHPAQIDIINDNLWVVDRNNYRVLMY